MIKKILLALNSTPAAAAAVSTAVQLAALHGAELTALALADRRAADNVGPVPIGAGPYAARLREHRMILTNAEIDKAIASFDSACKAAGIVRHVKRETGNPIAVTVSEARSHDLTICSLKGPFDYGVVSPVPTMLARLVDKGVRPIIATASLFRPVRRVLVVCDGSTESANAIKQYVQLKPWPDVTMLMAWCGPESVMSKRILSEAASYCHSHGYEVEVPEVSGIRLEALQPAAAFEADLTVMGNRARRFLCFKLPERSRLHAMRRMDRSLFLSE